MPWYNGWWMFPIVMPLMMIVFLAVALLIFRGVFWGRGPWWTDRPGEPEGDRALDILRQRLASGEITDEEYERKRQLLTR
ncbi:MAG: SHOCT domain-containing protein [Chloroflexi bacterium]|nr:SHOCT domain-containing protein [Chloroflexota bacterium]